MRSSRQQRGVRWMPATLLEGLMVWRAWVWKANEGTGRVRCNWDRMNARNLNWGKEGRLPGASRTWNPTSLSQGEERTRGWSARQALATRWTGGGDQGSQLGATNSLCDFRRRRWRRPARHQKLAPVCQFPERQVCRIKGKNQQGGSIPLF